MNKEEKRVEARDARMEQMLGDVAGMKDDVEEIKEMLEAQEEKRRSDSRRLRAFIVDPNFLVWLLTQKESVVVTVKSDIPKSARIRGINHLPEYGGLVITVQDDSFPEVSLGERMIPEPIGVYLSRLVIGVEDIDGGVIKGEEK